MELPRMTLAAAAFALAATALAAPAAETKTFDTAGLKELKIENASGTVKVRAAEGAQAKVVTTKKKFDDGCTLEIGVKGDELQIIAKDAAGLLSKCEVDIDAEVPRHLDAEVSLGSGDVEIVGLSGELDYKVGSGDLVVKDVHLHEVEGKTGSGDVRIDGTFTEAEITVGSGDAAITMTKAPAVGSLDVKVGTGSATVSLPKDAKVKSSFKSGLGTLTNEFTDSPDAKFTISGKAGTGDLTIKKL